MFTKFINGTLALALALLPTLMTAQLKQFTLDDLMWGGSNYWNLQPKNLYTAWWGDNLMQLEVEEVKQLANAKGKLLKSPVVLFTEADVNAALEKYGKVRNLLNANFPVSGETIAEFNTGKFLVRYDWTKKQIVWTLALPAGIPEGGVARASKCVAYLKDWNLFVQKADGTVSQISTDGSREMQYGLSVHRDEFGIHNGLFWSPKGNLLAFYKMDQTMVTDFPLVDNSPRVATLAPEKYPMAGMTSHKVWVGVYNPATDKTIYLQTGDNTDRYFTNVAWSPDEQTVYVIEVPRSQDKSELVAYDATTGARKQVLYTETNDRYVEPMTPIQFLPWDDTKFIYQSRRDGYNHLYLFDTTGKELAQLTKGNFEVIDVLGFNEKAKSIIYKSNEALPIRHNYYSVNVKTLKRTLLDNGKGVHSARLSASGNYLCDTWRAPGVYRQIDLLSTTKPVAITLHQAGTPWEGYNVPEFSCGTIKAADDSTALYYRMVKPVNFDPAKKYPAVVYVYGGPHSQMVQNTYMALLRRWEMYMAQRGYLVYVQDNRGTENRGLAFEQAIHGQCGQAEMADQIEGVKMLMELPYVDKDRIGVHGWSYGGFMTISLITNYPEIFKVAVAGGPVIDWKWYEVMYGERYMDHPERNPEGYAKTSLINKAKDLKGKLLICQGAIDPVVVWEHSLSFIRECIKNNVQVDYFPYPCAEHNVMGKDRVHLHDKISMYFEDYL